MTVISSWRLRILHLLKKRPNTRRFPSPTRKGGGTQVPTLGPSSLHKRTGRTGSGGTEARGAGSFARREQNLPWP
jgi:hypothetical protein